MVTYTIVDKIVSMDNNDLSRLRLLQKLDNLDKEELSAYFRIVKIHAGNYIKFHLITL